MTILDLLVGRKVMVMTDMKVEVPLTIKSVKEFEHREDLEPATKENDWWPRASYTKTITVVFTNNSSKTYNSINQIKLIDE